MYKHEHDIERNIRSRKRIIIGLIMMLISTVSFIIIFKTDYLTVKSVEIKGNNILSKEEIIFYSGITLGNNIFKEKIGQVHDHLMKDPYVKKVAVKRKLPNKILIHMEERKESAAIPFMNDYLIIDKEGLVLRSSPGNGQLKIMKGLQFSNFMEGELLKVQDKEQLSRGLTILNHVNNSNITLKELNITDKENIIINLTDTLYCEIGQGDDLNYKLMVLANVLKDLDSKGITRGVIDISHDGYPSFRPVE